MSLSAIVISKNNFKASSFLMQTREESIEVIVKKNIIVQDEFEVLKPLNTLSNKVEVLVCFLEFSTEKRIEILTFLFDNLIPFKLLEQNSNTTDALVFISKEFNIESIFESNYEEISTHWNQNSLVGKTILITGGAGSIGSCLVEELRHFNTDEIIILDKNEHHLYELKLYFEENYPSLNLKYILGDISDYNTLSFVFSSTSIDYVIHTAAYKQLPLLETFYYECARINILATIDLFEMAEKNNVEKFIFISTDKAVEPISVMGTTKHIAERLLFERSKTSKTLITSIRLGNVVNTRGSVIPFFQDRLTRSLPINITGDKMKRYFITKKMACNLILQSMHLSSQGDIFVFEMKNAIAIKSLAFLMLKNHLSSFKSKSKLNIVSKRPGEKLNEILISASEKKQGTKIRQISRITYNNIEGQELIIWFDKFKQAISLNDRDNISSMIKLYVKE